MLWSLTVLGNDGSHCHSWDTVTPFQSGQVLPPLHFAHFLTFCSFHFFDDVCAPPAVGRWEEMELRASRGGQEKGFWRVYMRRSLAPPS